MYKGIDTAAPITDAAAKKLRSLGYSFVARYLVPNKGSTAWKALTVSETDILRSAGLAILPCWETTGNRAKGGASAGTADGAAVKTLAQEMGVPEGTAICFAVDYDAPKNDYPQIEAYLRGAKAQIGGYLLGLYAPADVLNYLTDRSLPDYGWQCYAWNYGTKAQADVFQTAWQGNAEAKALEKQLGFAVDLDEAERLTGMWAPAGEDFLWAQRHGFLGGNPEDSVSKNELATILRRLYSWT